MTCSLARVGFKVCVDVPNVPDGHGPNLVSYAAVYHVSLLMVSESNEVSRTLCMLRLVSNWSGEE